MTDRIAIAAVKRFGVGAPQSDQDLVAAEAPLRVDLSNAHRPGSRPLGMLMRTPGDDEDLVTGLLYTEGVITTTADIVSMILRAATPDDAGDFSIRDQIVDVELASHVDLDPVVGERATLPTSACGLCGRLLLQVTTTFAGRARSSDGPSVSAAVIAALPAGLRAGQPAFAETGGLHAAGLFDLSGTRIAVREDVGRHNAVDKLVGAALRAGWLPANRCIVAVSGRVAFEIVHKVAMAGVPILVAVGAPSDLAIQAARAANLTLVGFTRDGRFNAYCGVERIGGDS